MGLLSTTVCLPLRLLCTGDQALLLAAVCGLAGRAQGPDDRHPGLVQQRQRRGAAGAAAGAAGCVARPPTLVAAGLCTQRTRGCMQVSIHACMQPKQPLHHPCSSPACGCITYPTTHLHGLCYPPTSAARLPPAPLAHAQRTQRAPAARSARRLRRCRSPLWGGLWVGWVAVP